MTRLIDALTDLGYWLEYRGWDRLGTAVGLVAVGLTIVWRTGR